MDPASEAFCSCPLESSFRYTSTILKDAAEAPGIYASLLPGAWSKAGNRCRAPSSARVSKTLACHNRELYLHPKTLACFKIEITLHTKKLLWEHPRSSSEMAASRKKQTKNTVGQGR